MTRDRRILRLKNDKGEFERVSEFLNEFGAAHNFDQEILFSLQLCVEEWLTNIISYGFVDVAEHWIDLRLLLEESLLTVEIEDDGMEFNPLLKPDPDVTKPLEDRPIGGLGIFLVRKLMDETEYQREANHNLLRLRKKIG